MFFTLMCCLPSHYKSTAHCQLVQQILSPCLLLAAWHKDVWIMYLYYSYVIMMRKYVEVQEKGQQESGLIPWIISSCFIFIPSHVWQPVVTHHEPLPQAAVKEQTHELSDLYLFLRSAYLYCMYTNRRINIFKHLDTLYILWCRFCKCLVADSFWYRNNIYCMFEGLSSSSKPT